MIKVYLDNNIVVDIEEGEKNLSSILETNEIKDPKIYFSSAHLREASEIKAETLQKRADRLGMRFKTLSDLTDNNYLHMIHPDNTIYEGIETPIEVFNTITETPTDNTIKKFVNLISEEHKNILREAIGIDMRRINNYTVEDVIDQVTKQHKALDGLSILGIVEGSIENNPQGDEMGIYNRFVGIFEFLDLLGYWKDKYTSKSNYARFCDSIHCYYASHCDILISNDKRMRYKSKVMYSLFGFETAVIDPYIKK